MSGDAANVGVRGAMGVGGMREGRVGGEERRRLVVERLGAAKSPVRGSDLAAEQGVSRQVIVQDIALLRSAGVNVASTNRGYVLETGTITKTGTGATGRTAWPTSSASSWTWVAPSRTSS